MSDEESPRDWEPRAKSHPSRTANDPPPFLLKTYELVSKPATDAIISWGEQGVSFIVWDTAALAKELPKYFKHNNFSSFVRQLNTYGFRKSDPDQWEFEREHFRRDNFGALNRIVRRKGQSCGGIGAPAVVLASQYPAYPPHLLHQYICRAQENGLETMHAPSLVKAESGSDENGRHHSMSQDRMTAPPRHGSGSGCACADQVAHSGIERLGMLAHTILEAEGGGSPRPKTDPRPNLADASHRPFWPSGSSQQFSLPGQGACACQDHSCLCQTFERLAEALMGRMADQASLIRNLTEEVQVLKRTQQKQAMQMSSKYAMRSSGLTAEDDVPRKRSKPGLLSHMAKSGDRQFGADSEDASNETHCPASGREPSSAAAHAQNSTVVEDCRTMGHAGHGAIQSGSEGLRQDKDQQDVAQRYKTPLERLRAYLASNGGNATPCSPISSLIFQDQHQCMQ